MEVWPTWTVAKTAPAKIGNRDRKSGHREELVRHSSTFRQGIGGDQFKVDGLRFNKTVPILEAF
jgi:hypothetical protein